MRVLLLLCFTSLFLSQSNYGQLTLTNPLICHDKDRFLRCYNDGDYILTFSNGNFREFKCADSSVKYSDIEKTLTFYSKRFGALTIDTIRIKLLPKSIELRKRMQSLEITSLKNISDEIRDYHVGTYSVDNYVTGLTFWAGDKYCEIELSTFGKTWTWNIVMRENSRVFYMGYNSYKKNRIGLIFIEDDSLRYGMSISSLKNLWRLRSSYHDTLSILKNGIPVIGDIPQEKNYSYEYNKSGRLKIDRVVGELKVCDCNFSEIRRD